MANKYKVILLDMDGTIAYTDEMIVQTFYRLYDMYNPDMKKDRSEIFYFSGPPLSITLPREFPNQDYKFMYDEFIRISTPYYDKYVVPFDNELEVLEKLKEAGYKLVIVTNKATKMAYYVLDIIKARNLFEFVIGSNDVSHPKPHQEGIELALAKLGVDKKEAIYIGDNDIDYQTAYNAGIDSMICNWGPRILNVLDNANYVVNSYLEIKDILL